MDEKRIAIIKNLFSSSLNVLLENMIPSETELEEKAAQVREMFSGSYPVSDEEYKNIIAYIKSEITVTMAGQDAVIEDRHSGYRPWLAEAQGEINWFFWNRYKKFLENDKHWNPRLVANLHRVSNRLLDLMGNPKAGHPFLRRGLVIGDVQSGKTANYTALCNKAADAGYHVIIVLTGVQEDLRKQTQQRLDTEFAGRDSAAFLNRKIRDKDHIAGVGVAKYKTDKKIAQFTSTIQDFRKTVLQNNSLDLKNINTTVLMVVKKNKGVLNNLAVWLGESCDPGQKKIQQSLLIIDDEADNASVNTSSDIDSPTAINKCIRQLLDMFYQASYVGITATPFANIFIEPDDEAKMEMEDLFPRDYIYVLDVPTNYIGPDALFGDSAIYGGALQQIDQDDIIPYFPYKHKKDWVVNGLPNSLYEAMNYFLLVNAIRDYRGDGLQHRSMLIHVSRFVNVHRQIRDIVFEWLDGVQRDLRNYSKVGLDKAEKIASIAALHDVFLKFDLKTIGGISWGKLLHEYLFKAVDTIVVSARYSGSQDTLNYEDYPDGLRVIAIGGNSFARGLTLEGLCVTYFYRRSKMYDTLMQMGRWFGYRANYADLCKVWISVEAIDWYGSINRATNELKDEIREMMEAGQTPLEFGLKVRQDPSSMIIVTAKNKMRATYQIKRPISVSKRLLETPRLKMNQLENNRKVVQSFITMLNQTYVCNTDVAKCAYFWRGVGKEHISNLLKLFDTDRWQLSYQGDALSEYIQNRMDDKLWDVAIPQLDSSGEVCDMLPCGSVRALMRTVVDNDGHILISNTKARVGSAGLTQIGLSPDKKKAAEEAFHSMPGKENKAVSDSAYLIQDRNPLLLIYVVQVKDAVKQASLPQFLFALGVGFPDNGTKVITATYVVNSTEYRNYCAEDLEEDDDR